jgi:DNA-binding response OmpR family regulator
MRILESIDDVSPEAVGGVRVEARATPRILLAEDDDEMRLLLGEALEEAGYEVNETEDGATALASLRALARHGIGMPDALVLDVRMPGTSGVDVLTELRAAGWQTPVILISGFGDEALRASALRLGAAAMLEKPFDFDELAMALSVVLGAPGAPPS